MRDDLYDAVITPSHGQVEWKTEGPMRLDELDKKLFEFGRHQTGYRGCILNEADPDWVQRSKQVVEVLQGGTSREGVAL